jgi:spore maturation protein CgeB
MTLFNESLTTGAPEAGTALSLESASQLAEIIVPITLETLPKPVITQARFARAAFGAAVNVDELTFRRFNDALKASPDLKYIGNNIADSQYLVKGREELARLDAQEIASIRDELVAFIAEKVAPAQRVNLGLIVNILRHQDHFLTQDELNHLLKILKNTPHILHTREDTYVYYK